MRLGRVARHAHVLAIGEPPAMQRHFLHRGHHMGAIGAEGDGGVAALPFQQAGLVFLRTHEPHRGAIVMARRHPLAFGVDRDAGHGGRMRQRLQRLARAIQQMQRAADRGRAHAIRVGRHMLDPAAAIFRQHRACGGGMGQLAVIAAGEEAGFHIGAKAQHRALMRLMGGKVGADMHAAIAQAKARRTRGAAEIHRHHIGAQFPPIATGGEEEIMFCRLAHEGGLQRASSAS